MNTLKLSELTQRIADFKEKVVRLFAENGLPLSVEQSSNDIIRLVFVGQYSAGKSSILKMLTGRNDIEVGAGITTQSTHTYEWKGMEVVDTPGIHTGLREDHDKISYEAIANADLLVFVITNELFDSHLADHFRKLAIDKDKAGEMILVVNKMSRTNDGNSPEQQRIIRDDLVEVLLPYTPEQLNLSFLDAEYFLDSLCEDDPENAAELVAQSGYNAFIDTLDRFISAKKIPAKLTTGLYVLEDQIQKAVTNLEPGNEDEDLDALEEHFKQQRHIIFEARNRLQQEVKDIFFTAAAGIKTLGLDSANLLSQGCKKEEVEEGLAEKVRQADALIETCQQNATEVVDARLSELGQSLDSLENSEFSKELKLRLEGKFEGLPENIKRVLSSAVPGLQKAGQAIASNSYKTGVQGGLKLTNFSGSTVHNLVLKAGHAIGYKFKPWQAIKLTKGIAIGGRVLSIFGVGLSVFMQIKSDHDEDKMHTDLMHNRQNIRSQFNDAACELEDYGTKYVSENITKALAAPLTELDEKIDEIRTSKLSRSSACRQMESLERECKQLIHEIHMD